MNGFRGILLAAGLVPILGQAAIINYVDADLSASPSSNTFLATAGTPIAAGSLGGWATRGLGASSFGSTDTVNFANEGNVLQGANGDSAHDTLRTTISGLNPLLAHDVYAFFWSGPAGSQDWDVKAGLTQTGLNDYGVASPGAIQVTAANIADFSGLNVLGQGADDYTDFIDGNRTLWAAPLGQVALGATSIDVFVNTSGLDAGQRTWYDGVGFAVPEPSGAVLRALGLAAIIFVRRRR